MEKHKFASITLTMRDRAISLKFSNLTVSQQTTLGNFPKIFLPLKITTILSCRIFAKNAKIKIFFTVRDRAISSKFSTHRVSQQTTLCNFQKNFLSPKMAAILKFRIFAKNAKTQICFYLLNHARDRAILSKFLTYRVSQQFTLANFVQVLEHNSCFPLGGHYACQCILFLVHIINVSSVTHLI